MGTKQRYNLPEGKGRLLMDSDEAESRYHGACRQPRPTLKLHFLEGARITQAQANRVAELVYGTTIIVTQTHIEVSSTRPIRDWDEACTLAVTIVEELCRVISAPDRTKSRRVAHNRPANLRR